MLHHRRGVDESQDAVAVNKAVHQFLLFRAIGMDGDIADTLAGQRQIFRVGSGDNARCKTAAATDISAHRKSACDKAHR